ncbi:MAG: TlpA family protein disulfide reductase [Flavobacteriaceae bacterium]|nr:TlpA family protein disulfide reductase [Flavobacteriaceae bacterium]
MAAQLSNKKISFRYKALILFSCLMMIFACVDQKKEKEAVSDTSMSFVNLNGEKVALKDFKGKRVLVNYWASWCTPCLKEMPSLVHAQEILRDDNYVFLFPTTDDLEKISAFQKNRNYPLKFLHYPATLDQLDIYALPATFIYDTNGLMVKRIDGATVWDSHEIIKLLKSIE